MSRNVYTLARKKHITKTYGDPSIGTYEKPETISLQKWVLDLVNRRDRRRLCEHILRSIPDDDMSMYGYPIETVWAPLNDVNMSGQSVEVENASLRDRFNFDEMEYCAYCTVYC